MSEYWKSNAKKFCEICKTWFADNKISIENHERGLKHKGMVQQRLRESGQKAREKERKEYDLRHTLLCMEQAAFVSMQKDVEDEKEKKRASHQANLVPRSSAAIADPREEIRAQKRKLAELKKTSKRSQFWDADGGSSTFQDDQAQKPPIAEPVSQTNEVRWVQSETEDGRMYYWNIFTGDTRWDVPDERFYTTAQYNQKYAEIAAEMATNAYFAAGEIPNSSAGGRAFTPEQETKFSPGGHSEPKKKSRFDDQGASSSQHRQGRGKDQQIKGEPKIEPPPVGLIEIKHTPLVDPTENIEEPKPQSNHVLGPWIRVIKPIEKEKPQMDDLPDQDQKTDKDPSEIAEELSLDPAELSFKEKIIPVDASSKQGRTKVVEFKKRTFANKKNMRSNLPD